MTDRSANCLRARSNSTRQRRDTAAADLFGGGSGCTRNRYSANNGCRRACAGRKRMPKPPPTSTANCNRRHACDESFSTSHTTSPMPRVRNACSRDHSASSGCSGRMHTVLPKSTANGTVAGACSSRRLSITTRRLSRHASRLAHNARPVDPVPHPSARHSTKQPRRHSIDSPPSQNQEANHVRDRRSSCRSCRIGGSFAIAAPRESSALRVDGREHQRLADRCGA